ncbi:hypothetical protein DFQ28_007014 [Apophysomyces sp. BC1034]|nr:hypothetical protein DFQ29_005865 [Apophysomyces sp. BC1021]KAG0187007.1 hypothetical protein DFQ28_007014 [Apophysomyces sp. BC1034]
MTPLPRRTKRTTAEPPQSCTTELTPSQHVMNDPEDTKHQNVMSIDFLCCNEMEDDAICEQPKPNSPLDLLCNVVMDAKYLRVDESESTEITVIVDQEIHKDISIDTTEKEVDLQNTEAKKSENTAISREDSQRSSCVSSPYVDGEVNDNKADSAIGLSPHGSQRDDFDESKVCDHDDSQETAMHKQWKEDISNLSDEGFSDMGDFLDDISDLSSVRSSDMWSDSEESISLPQKKTPLKKGRQPMKQESKDLLCIACGRALREEVLEQSKPDLSIADELATWSWSPSALFTDWRPKRCPRCERHFTIFRQEWPNRKIKKPSNRKKIKGKKLKRVMGEDSKRDATSKDSPLTTKKNAMNDLLFQENVQAISCATLLPSSSEAFDEDPY